MDEAEAMRRANAASLDKWRKDKLELKAQRGAGKGGSAKGQPPAEDESSEESSSDEEGDEDEG